MLSKFSHGFCFIYSVLEPYKCPGTFIFLEPYKCFKNITFAIFIFMNLVPFFEFVSEFASIKFRKSTFLSYCIYKIFRNFQEFSRIFENFKCFCWNFSNFEILKSRNFSKFSGALKKYQLF
jgi:hypothetical protein